MISRLRQHPGILVLIGLLSTPAILGAAAPFTLFDGTPVRMRLSQTVSSADAHVGQTVSLEVLDEVRLNGLVVVPKGATAIATVTKAKPKGHFGHAGQLDINIDYVRLADDQKAALRAVKDVKGGGHTGAMTGAMVATSLVFLPAAPLFLFMHGKDVAIPQGTEITAFVNGDMHLNPTDFRGSAAGPAPRHHAVVSASHEASGSALTNDDIIKLVASGLGSQVIVDKIHHSTCAFDMDTNALVALKKAHVPDRVIDAMVAAGSHPGGEEAPGVTPGFGLGYHFTSSTPARWLIARARTKRKSERRFV